MLYSAIEKESGNHNGQSTPWRDTIVVDDERLHGLFDRRYKSGTRTEREIHIQISADAESGWCE